jgi:hypothetical protein
MNLNKWKKFLFEEEQEVKKLRVFDLDDTLVKTSGKVKLTLPTGQFRYLDPAEYAVYEPKEGETYGDDAYEQFHSLIDPQMIKYTTSIFKSVYNAGLGEQRKLAILTARGPMVKQSLEDWLTKAVKINPRDIEIITLGDSDPLKKREWIEQQIMDGGYNDIEFFDDSEKNVRAVMSLKNDYPHIKLRSRRVVADIHEET